MWLMIKKNQLVLLLSKENSYLVKKEERKLHTSVGIIDLAKLKDYGKVKKVTQTRRTTRGGFIYRRLSIKCEEGKVGVSMLEKPGDKMEQFYVYPTN